MFDTVNYKSQTDLLLDHFKVTPTISGVEAWSLYGIRSLTRRITDLRELGHTVQSERRVAPNGQRYVRYHFVRAAQVAKAA